VTIDTVIYQKLAAIGSTYPDSMPAGATIPGMAYQFISERQFPSQSGPALKRRRLQVSCWGTTKAMSETLADSVRAALDYNKTGIELIAPVDQGDFKDPESGLYRRTIDFFVWST
jgi:hypothetical protein